MPKTLGLVADPVVVAETVERTGPDVAARLRGDWHVRTDEETFAAGQELRELSQRAEELADEHGWDAVIVSPTCRSSLRVRPCWRTSPRRSASRCCRCPRSAR